MTILKPAATIDQLTAGGRFPHDDCGESCVASILRDAGHPNPVRAIEEWDATHGENVADGTGGDVHAEFLTLHGVPAHVVTGPVHSYVSAALRRGHRCMVGIFSDVNGDPGGPLGHWVLVWGLEGSQYYVMNPIGGRLVRYPVARFEASSQNYGVEIDMVLLADRRAFPDITILEVLASMALFKDDDDARHFAVRFAFRNVLHRQIESTQVQENWARFIVDHGMDEFFAAIMDSPEGQKNLEAERRLLLEAVPPPREPVPSRTPH